MTWDFSNDPELDRQIAWVRQFVEQEVYPLETMKLELDEWEAVTAPLKEQVKAAGLWAPHLPVELGGGGHGLVALALLYEQTGRSLLADEIFGNQAPDAGNAVMMAPVVTDEQRTEWLEPLLDGRLRSGFSMTEPDTAGSDPTLIATTAVRDGDDWVINGHKWFTSQGHLADFLLVVCRTGDREAAHENFSVILVPTSTPGVNIVRPSIANLHNMEGSSWGGQQAHSEILYEDVRVPCRNLLGEEGHGFALSQARLGPARTHRCMSWIGLAHRVMDMMCERAVSRHVSGSRLADKQAIQGFIADSAIEISAARLMTLHTAWLVDLHGARAARTEISQIKVFVAEVLCRIVDRAMQIHGALGYSRDLPLEEMYRWARMARIVDGADEVHRSVIARQVMRAVEPVEVPTEHIPTRRARAEARRVSL